MSDIAETGLFEPLTDRESTILAYLVEGLSNADIAERMFLSPSTVKWYVRQLNSKLNTRNRNEIIERVNELSLLDVRSTAEMIRVLPTQMFPFSGRQTELQDLMQLLRNPATRLVTLLGPGGMGKTSLALEVVRQQTDLYDNGVFFVDLAAVGSPTDTAALCFVYLINQGHSLEQTISEIVDNAHEPLTSYFQQALDDLKRGHLVDRVLAELQERVGGTHLSQVLGIARKHLKTGEDLTIPLNQWRDDMRAEIGDTVFLSKLDYAQTHLCNAIAGAMAFQFQDDGRSTQKQLIDHLTKQNVLLVLDNFEHMIDSSGFLTDLLQSASRVKLLVTSREKLNLFGETVYTLYGMQLPQSDSANLFDSDAVQFFAQSARRVRPDFSIHENNIAAVVRICRLTEGMPLGLLLASAWLDVLTLEEIAEEIEATADFLETEKNDIPDRQRSIRAVFSATWQRLSSTEQTILMKLSIFRNGWTRAAADTVAGASLRTLQSLVSKSLIWLTDDGRYRIHELIRQYAAVQLDQSEEAQVLRTRYSDYYLKLLRDQNENMKGKDQIAALSVLDAEIENIRAAWLYAVNYGDWEQIVTSFESLSIFTNIRGLYQLHRELIQHARQQFTADALPEWAWEKLQTRRWAVPNTSHRNQHELQQAQRQLQRGLAVARENNDLLEMSYVLSTRTYLEIYSDDHAHLLQTTRENHAVSEQMGDPYYISWALYDLGYAHRVLGDFDTALDYIHQSLKVSRQIGNLAGVVQCLLEIGSILLTHYGDYKQGDLYLTEAYTLGKQVGAHYQTAHASNLASMAAFCKGDFDRARIIADREQALMLQTGLYLDVALNTSIHAMLDCVVGNFESAMQRIENAWQYPAVPGDDFYLHWAAVVALEGLGRYQEIPHHVAQMLRCCGSHTSLMLLALPEIGFVLYLDGQIKRAVELIGCTLAHPASPTGWLESCPILSDFCHQLEDTLGKETFDEALKRGNSLDLSSTIDEFRSLLLKDEPVISLDKYYRGMGD